MAETPPLPYGNTSHYGKDYTTEKITTMAETAPLPMANMYTKAKTYTTAKMHTMAKIHPMTKTAHYGKACRQADREIGPCHVQEVHTGKKKDGTVATRVVTLAKLSVALARTATLVRKGLHATQKCHTDKVIKFGRKIFCTGKKHMLAKPAVHTGKN